MSRFKECLECGTPLSEASLGGLCCACALRGALTLSQAGSPADLFLPGTALPQTGLSGHEPFWRFGDYEVLGEIGHGGMGVVFKARQKSLGRMVALKMIRAERLIRPGDVRRFRQEAAAAAKLQHPSIVAIHEAGEVDGQQFYSMDLVEGQSLAAIAREHPLPARKAAVYVQAIAQAIHFAHQQGILHRDLKPSNILIDAHDRPHVTDFGLAKVLQSDSDLTLTGHVMGSPCYMAPEQAAGQSRDSDARTDVYALGAILYELVSGLPPFKAATPVETLKLVVETEPVAPSVLNPRLPRDLETVCLKCLEKQRERRYASAQLLADELGRFLDQKPILARSVGPAGKIWRWCRRRPALAGMGAGLAVMLALGSAGVLWQWRQAQHERRWAQQGEYAAEMHLAQQALLDNNLARALQLLLEHRPGAQSKIAPNRRPKPGTDLRGWEWRYLWPQCQSDAWLTFSLGSSPIGALVFASGGRLLAVRDQPGNVTLLDLSTREQIARWDREAHKLRALAVSPDGNLLALSTYSSSGTPIVELWDLKTRKPAGQLPHGEDGAVWLAFSPDRASLASWASDQTVRIWNLSTLKVMASFPASPASGEHKGVVAFSPDGHTLAIGETDGRIRLIATANYTERTNFLAQPHGEGITALAFSANSQFIASTSGYSDGVIRLWEVATGQSAGQLEGHGKWILALALSPDGRTLASASADHTVRLWNIETRECNSILRGHSSEVWALAFSPDGRTLAGGTKDGSICFWDPEAKPPLHAVRKLAKTARRAVFAPESRTFYTLNLAGSISEWNAITGEEIGSVLGLGADNVSLAVSPNGQIVTTATAAGTIKVWNRKDPLQLTRFRAHPTVVQHLEFFSQGRRLISVASNRTVKVWTVPAWRQEMLLRLDPQPWPLESVFAVSPDGHFIAIGDAYGVTVWNLATAEKVTSLKGSFGWLSGLAFSPDSQQLAVGSSSGSTKLFQVGTWRDLTLERGNLLGVAAVAFSPDGRRLITGDDLKLAVRVWDLATFQELVRLEGEGTHFHFAAFSPDGNTIVGINQQGIAHLWRAPSWEEIEETARHRP